MKQVCVLVALTYVSLSFESLRAHGSDGLIDDVQKECGSFGDGYGFNETYYGNIGSLNIVIPCFPQGNKYEFVVQYGEDQYSVDTFVLDWTDDWVLYNDLYGGGGDRFGNDREGSSAEGTAKRDVFDAVQSTSSDEMAVFVEPEPAEAVPRQDGQPPIGSTSTYDQGPVARSPGREDDRSALPLLRQVANPMPAERDVLAVHGDSIAVEGIALPGPSAVTPVRGPVSVAVVGALSAAGAAVFWKLFGGRLVKPR